MADQIRQCLGYLHPILWTQVRLKSQSTLSQKVLQDFDLLSDNLHVNLSY